MDDAKQKLEKYIKLGIQEASQVPKSELKKATVKALQDLSKAEAKFYALLRRDSN